MKPLRFVFALGMVSIISATEILSQQSTIYVSVLSTKLFVVGAANPQTGLFYKRTTDDTVWQHTGPKNIRAFGLGVHTPSKGSALVIASGNGVHRSTDGGATWKITTGWEITEVLSVAVDPRNANVVFCATPYGVYRTTDGGLVWHESNNGITQKCASSVIVDTHDSRVLYCTTEDGAYRSDDRGGSWTRTGLNVGGVRCIAQNPKNPAMLVVGTDDHGVYITNNSGKYWEKSEAGLDHFTFYSVVFDPTDPQKLYAGGYVTGVYKSTDGGKSWARKNSGLTNLNVRSIAVDPTRGSRVVVGTQYGGVFQSDDAGETWRSIGLNGSQAWTVSIQPF